MIQAEMSWPIPQKLGDEKKGQDVHIPHCYILRFDSNSKITRLDAYWDNTVLQQYPGERCVMERPSRGGSYYRRPLSPTIHGWVLITDLCTN